MSKSVWEKIYEIVQQGQCPEVTLRPEWEITKEKQPSGRPRVRHPNNPYSHFAGYNAFRKRPTCRAYRCKKFLKRDQALCCSQECLDDLLSYVTDIMSRIEVRHLLEILQGVLGPDYRIFQREYIAKKRPRLSKLYKELLKVSS